MNAHQLDLLRLRWLQGQPAGGAGIKVLIEGQDAVATSPEGQQASMPIEALLSRVASGQLSSGPAMLPDGLKAVLSTGAITIWVWECPPRVHQFSWIANDSPAPFGKGASYRLVSLALPYLVVFAVFARNEAGLPVLTPNNECFFRTAPLKRFDDELFYPALLNCSKFVPPDGRPLSWICTQHLKATPKMQSPDPAERYIAAFEALRHCMLETAFNYSSEHHEGASWYTESRRVDPKIHTVEAWEQASRESPLFVLDLSWLKTGHTVGQVADRIFTNLRINQRRIQSAAGLARIIFNHK
jgi:hypothetical protein